MRSPGTIAPRAMPAVSGMASARRAQAMAGHLAASARRPRAAPMPNGSRKFDTGASEWDLSRSDLGRGLGKSALDGGGQRQPRGGLQPNRHQDRGDHLPSD